MEAQLVAVPFQAASASFRRWQKAVDAALGNACDAVQRSSTAEDLDAIIASLQAAKDAATAEAPVGAAAVANLQLAARSIPSSPLPTRALLAAHADREGWPAASAALHAGLPAAASALLQPSAAAAAAINAAAAALAAGDVAPALRWATAHASRLRRCGSDALFRLRRGQFLALAQAGRAEEALACAKAHLTPPPGGALAPLQQLMGVLAFPAPATCGVPAVEQLFAPQQRAALAAAFLRDARLAAGLGARSPLLPPLAAGLAALRTPACGSAEDAEPDCPACAGGALGALAARVPMARRRESALRCASSGAALGEGNAAWAVPRTGRPALLLGAAALPGHSSGDGRSVLPPGGGEPVPRSALRRVFLA